MMTKKESKFTTSRTPYLREIMDLLSENNPKDVVIMKGAAIGKTMVTAEFNKQEEEIRNAYKKLEELTGDREIQEMTPVERMTVQLKSLKEEGFIEDYYGVREENGRVYYNYTRKTPIERIAWTPDHKGYYFGKRRRVPRKLKKKLKKEKEIFNAFANPALGVPYP